MPSSSVLVLRSRVVSGIDGEDVGEGEGLGVGLAAISSNGTASRLSVELRAVCFPPIEGFRLRLPLLQSRLARLETSVRRDEDATMVPAEPDSRTFFRRCLSVISHCRSVCQVAAGELTKEN